MDLKETNDSLILFFSKLHIDLNNSWLQDATKYLKSQNIDINFDKYKDFIFYQLIYSNLCNSIVVKKTFPWNENKKLCQERINLFVQLKSVYNISRPALEQYLEMSFQNCISIGDFDLQSNNSESTNSSNYKNKYSPRGMLMLNVTDGKNNFIAIESLE
uniref:RecQ-mediated genome instability protein 1 n=1 Tax=Strongyloides stercoralis TaxID=6248 RepID=A0A0K0DUU6_STRER